MPLERDPLDPLIAVMLETRSHRLAALAEDPRWDVRAEAARRPAMPVACLAALASDPSAHVRAAVAQHAGTPAEVLAVLATDTDPEVISAAAGNPRTTMSTILALLASSTPPTDMAVTHWALRTRQRVPQEVISRLLDSPDIAIRRSVIGALTRLCDSGEENDGE